MGILYGVCYQDGMEPWGWEPLAIRDDIDVPKPFDVPLRSSRDAAEADLARVVEDMNGRRLHDGEWSTEIGTLSVQEFDFGG
jgi:hypothetical protein